MNKRQKEVIQHQLESEKAVLEQVEKQYRKALNDINTKIRKRHVARLQRGECTIELGFVLNDIINNLERVADHCSNIAGCVIEMEHDALDLHDYLAKLKSEENSRYTEMYNDYREKYVLPPKDVV